MSHKFIAAFTALFLVLFTACATTGGVTTESFPVLPDQPEVPESATAGLSLLEAIAQSAGQISSQLPAKTRVAIVAFSSQSSRLSEFIIDELIVELVITGQLRHIGHVYRFSTSATRVETATRVTVPRFNVRDDQDMQSMVAALNSQATGVQAASYGGTAQSAPVAAPPPVPRNLRSGTIGTDRVTVLWDSAGVGFSYRIYYHTLNNPADALSRAASGTSIDISGLTGNTQYYFWVSTVQDGREGDRSAALTVRTAAAQTASAPQTAPVAVQPAAQPVRSVPAGFVRINGGTFTMGSPSYEANRSNDEFQHQVTVSAFYMGRYEVTQREYETVMGTNPSSNRGPNLPVVNVTWFDAVNYCNRRSQREGLISAYTISGTNVTWNRSANGYRLPTEAEWEYACRAGTTSAYNTGSSITKSQANIDSRSTTEVGRFSPNSWGLYDMHGNVWEWCWDWYGEYSFVDQTDPRGASSGSRRVLRGGSWDYGAQDLRSAARSRRAQSGWVTNVGFRVVLPL
uniref:Serine/threonine kinase n=1 Tax=uncultured bacterium contig00014 TaxID=1181505 RepID=A0A806KJY8_9BACT|nr:serine/threonine kinase [uncultured bacterium contig00014]